MTQACPSAAGTKGTRIPEELQLVNRLSQYLKRNEISSKPSHLLLELNKTIKHFLFSFYSKDIQELVVGPQVTRSLHSKLSMSSFDGCCQPKLHPHESFTAEFRVGFSPTRGNFHTFLFITRYKDLVFKNKLFCFIINLSGERA